MLPVCSNFFLSHMPVCIYYHLCPGALSFHVLETTQTKTLSLWVVEPDRTADGSPIAAVIHLDTAAACMPIIGLVLYGGKHPAKRAVIY